MVGFVIVWQFVQCGDVELVLCICDELDLFDGCVVQVFFVGVGIDQVYLVVVKVGGIVVNNMYLVDFIYENMMIESNIIYVVYLYNVNKLLFFGLFCIYLKLVRQLMVESELLQGMLELINELYVIVKIVGIKLCEFYNWQYGCDYCLMMLINLYGLYDNFYLDNLYVILVLLCCFYEVVQSYVLEVVVWGSGMLMCEFLYVDDMVVVSIYVMELVCEVWQENIVLMLLYINVGIGVDCIICELVQIIVKVVGYQGWVVFDVVKLDGMLCKLFDVMCLYQFGWYYEILLEVGFVGIYQWFFENQ